MAIRYLSGINVDSNTLFVDDANNRVGIGTNSPSRQLELVGADAYIQLTRSSTSTQATLGFNTGATNDWLIRTGDGSTSNLQFYSYGTSSYVMTIARSSGNVGIGTTSPSYNLDVSGDIRSTTINLGTQGVNVSSYGFLSQTLSGQMTFLGHNVRASSTVNNTALVVNGGWISSLIKQYYNEGITFHTSTTEYAAGATYPLADTERMRITSAGNVGIGTTLTFGRLQISGTVVNPDLSSATATGVSLVISNSDTGYGTMFATYGNGNGALQQRRTNTNTYYDFLLQPHGGNVGIGTSSPVVKLQVDGTITSTGVLTAYTSVPSINIGHNGDSAFIAATSGSGANTPISFSVGNNNEKMRITADGNVGIGTTSPSTKLDVIGVGAFGTMTSSRGTYSNGLSLQNNTGEATSLFLWQSGVASAHIGSPANSTSLHIVNSYNTGLITDPNSIVLTNTGNVGIGTTSPGAKLEIAQNTDNTDGPTLRIANNANTLSNGQLIGAIDFYNGDDSGTGNAVGAFIRSFTADAVLPVSSQYLSFAAGGTTERMRIASTGATRLNAYGSGSFTGTVAYNLAVDSSGNIIETAGGVVDGSGTANYVTKWIDGNTVGNSLIYDDGTTITFQTGASERMRITSDGNVGIGTTIPTAKLDVEGTWKLGDVSGGSFKSYTFGTQLDVSGITSGGWARAHKISTSDSSGHVFFGALGNNTTLTRAYWTIGDPASIDVTGYNSSNGVILLKNGNVGIGTTSPSRKLIVYDTDANVPTIGLRTDGSGTTTGDGFDLQFASSNTFLFNRESGYMSFGTDNTERVRITSAGNVGIGTTSPSDTLDLYQAANTTAIRLTSAGVGSNIYRLTSQLIGVSNAGFGIQNATDGRYELAIDGSGNVGIGTTAPSEKLELSASGNIYGKIISTTTGGNAGVRFLSTGAREYGIFTDGDLRFYDFSASAERMRITSAGNVGIGTTSPAYKLQVDGSTGVRNGSFYIGDESGSTNSAVEFYKSGTTIRMYTNTGAFGGTYGATSASLTLYSGSAYSTLINGNGDSYFNAGNFGIGTASPTTKLHVVGYSRNDGGLLLNGSDADYREIIFTTSAASRWNLYAYGGEGGSNAGSVLYLARYADNGDYIANVATFLRTNGYVGIATTTPTQQLHVTGNIRVTGAYYDSSNSAGSSGQVLSSTGSGTAWVNQGEATATSLFDLLPAARTTYAWSVQLTAGTWADIFSSNTVLSNGTWMVQVYVDDYAVGGQQYQETYSGIMSWGSANTTNQGGPEAISEVVLHRSGHAANAGNFYLRTVERVTSTLLLQGMSNQTYSAASTINFKFVKIF